MNSSPRSTALSQEGCAIRCYVHTLKRPWPANVQEVLVAKEQAAAGAADVDAALESVAAVAVAAGPEVQAALSDAIRQGMQVLATRRASRFRAAAQSGAFLAGGCWLVGWLCSWVWWFGVVGRRRQ